MSTFTLAELGPAITSEGDATDIIGETFGTGTDLIVIPVARLSPEFFRLSTGLAGAVLQKFSTYRLRIAIVGDISAYTEKSAPLRDFVRESNRHGDVRFLETAADL